MVHLYGEMSDDLYLKPFLPMLSILWKVYKELGWEGVDNYEAMGTESIYKFFETRLNESIFTSQDVLSNSIQNPDKVLSYIIMLPNVSIRSDLCIGTMKLFTGESCDVTFCTVRDDDSSVLLLLNCHVEDGIPVDWFMIREDDEILNRRHMKLGHKLRDIPKKAKNMKKAASIMQDVLRDIRNERTPEWAHAQYFSANVLSSWAINLMCIPSNYESIGEMYDGWASKEKYGLPDYTFALLPFPTAFNMFFLQGRGDFIKKIAGLTTETFLYMQPWEEYNYELIKRKVPHLFKIYKEGIESEGIPFPIQSVNSEYPNLKKQDINIKFDKNYPQGPRIMLDELELEFDEFAKGVYFDINLDTKPQQVGKDRIISKGIGRSTVFV
ncbi:MAG: hypothetical protein EAX96_07075 [Candidatus Lokiarchaeota archaeon]|nr:hypothetical protein [Candidatus Lokiarchaeota archaeon]